MPQNTQQHQQTPGQGYFPMGIPQQSLGTGSAGRGSGASVASTPQPPQPTMMPMMNPIALQHLAHLSPEQQQHFALQLRLQQQQQQQQAAAAAITPGYPMQHNQQTPLQPHQQQPYVYPHQGLATRQPNLTSLVQQYGRPHTTVQEAGLAPGQVRMSRTISPMLGADPIIQRPQFGGVLQAQGQTQTLFGMVRPGSGDPRGFRPTQPALSASRPHLQGQFQQPRQSSSHQNQLPTSIPQSLTVPPAAHTQPGARQEIQGLPNRVPVSSHESHPSIQPYSRQTRLAARPPPAQQATATRVRPASRTRDRAGASSRPAQQRPATLPKPSPPRPSQFQIPDSHDASSHTVAPKNQATPPTQGESSKVQIISNVGRADGAGSQDSVAKERSLVQPNPSNKSLPKAPGPKSIFTQLSQLQPSIQALFVSIGNILHHLAGQLYAGVHTLAPISAPDKLLNDLSCAMEGYEQILDSMLQVLSDIEVANEEQHRYRRMEEVSQLKSRGWERGKVEQLYEILGMDI